MYRQAADRQAILYRSCFIQNKGTNCQNGVNSYKKAFAPWGANSFPLELAPFWKGFVIQGSQEEVTECFPHSKKGRKHLGLPIHCNKCIIAAVTLLFQGQTTEY